MTAQTVTESEKMELVSGIEFADGPTGRRARIAGTGLDVFEVIGPWKHLNHDRQQLQAAFHWLTDEQREAALTFYARYPEEIDERLQREECLTEETVWQRYPFTGPR